MIKNVTIFHNLTEVEKTTISNRSKLYLLLMAYPNPQRHYLGNLKILVWMINI